MRNAKPIFFLPALAFMPVIGWLNLANPTLAQLPVREIQPLMGATPQMVEEQYILGAGDRVRLDILSVSDYNGEYQVLADGSLSLPLVGAVSVQGMGINQATEAITTRYAQFLRRPRLSIILTNARPIKVAIAGEVNRPGTYNVTASSTTTGGSAVPSLTSAIQLAGGITQLADIRRVRVQRVAAVGVAAGNILDVDLWQLVQTADIQQDIPLRDGDSILIPTATAMNPSEASKLAAASFSPTTITVNVVGEVEKPGAVTVPPNTPLNQALLAAGGFTGSAKKGSVEFIRLNPNGTVSRRDISVDFAQALNDTTNPALRNYDTILVRKSGFANFSETLGRILSPFTGAFSLINLLGL